MALVGLTILTLGTIPFAFLDGSTSYTLLAALLVVRGFGIGGSMMPAMAAAYATLQRDAIPRATSSLNALQRIGGSIGTAVLAVVLQGEIKDQLAAAQVGEAAPAASGTLERLPEDLRTAPRRAAGGAFASTFWWAVGISVLALVPATVLALTQRRSRRDEAAPRRSWSPRSCRPDTRYR